MPDGVEAIGRVCYREGVALLMHKPSCEARAGRGSRARHTGGDVTPRAGQDSPVMSRWPQPWVFMLMAGQPSENRLRVTSQLSRSALHPEQAMSPSPCLSLLSYTMGRAQSDCGDYKVSQHSRPATLTLLLAQCLGHCHYPQNGGYTHYQAPVNSSGS